jgi:hypothetical protein
LAAGNVTNDSPDLTAEHRNPPTADREDVDERLQKTVPALLPPLACPVVRLTKSALDQLDSLLQRHVAETQTDLGTVSEHNGSRELPGCTPRMADSNSNQVAKADPGTVCDSHAEAAGREVGDLTPD